MNLKQIVLNLNIKMDTKIQKQNTYDEKEN